MSLARKQERMRRQGTAAHRRAWQLFFDHGLSINGVRLALQREGFALSNFSHPTNSEVQKAMRSYYRRLRGLGGTNEQKEAG